jgi:hypothetical protein
MPRKTRSSIKIQEAECEENPCDLKKPQRRPRKRKSSSESDNVSDASSNSPVKNSRSNSISPISDRIAKNLNVHDETKTNKFRSARRALADNANFRLPGREKQFDDLTKFLDDLISLKKSASLYINGPPGLYSSALL